MKKTVVPALILTVICFVAVALLVLTNLLTATRIEEAKRRATASAAESVLPDARLEELNLEGIRGYIGYGSGGETVGYVFINSAKGYGGDVTAIVGVSADGKITGVSVTAADETPGLGANVSKDKFTSQFVGKDTADGYDAVSGATYSSEAARESIDKALENFKTVTEKGGK